jgi:uncharacterized LabA/DUF88 family protein
VKTVVYIDGFNLFYGLLKGSPNKWLDLNKFCKNILPSHCDIVAIKFYTALVNDRPHNLGSRDRQNIYLRALIKSGVQVIKGRYTEHPKAAPLVSPNSKHAQKINLSSANQTLFDLDKTWQQDPGPLAHIINSEEKGTDVNLSVDIVNDAWQAKFDCCVLISNDNDIARPLEIVRDELNKYVILVHATRRNGGQAAHLKKFASEIRTAREAASSNNQFPYEIPDSTIRKPDGW